MGTGVPLPGAIDSPLEEEAEGEPGTGVVEFPDEDMVVNGTGAEVEERLECRMYRAASLSISCCSSENPYKTLTEQSRR